MITLEQRVINFSFKTWLKKNWKVLVVLILFICLTYASSLNNDFVSDDISSIATNPDIEKTSYFVSGNTFNLRLALYFTINKIFGRNPFFFRLGNILFHIGVVSLIFLLLSILIDSEVAGVCAAILAVHPIQSESITWISGGAYPQYSFFLILSFVAYILSYKNSRLFLVSVASFILGILSSLLAIVFPLILLLFIVCFDNLRRAGKKLLIFFVIDGVVVFVCLSKLIARISEFQTSLYIQPKVYNPLFYIPIAVTSYLELIFWPKNLTLYHAEMVITQAEYTVRLVVFILFLVAVAYSYKRSRAVFFWSSFFVVSLLPMLVPSEIHLIVAERYVYLGAIGIFTVVALWLNKLGKAKKTNDLARLIFGLIIIALMARTIVRNVDWKNESNFWLASVKANPGSSHAHAGLGNVYSQNGDFEKAIAEYKQAIKIKPSFLAAYNNLGMTYSDMGKYDEAIAYYKKAITISPQFAEAYLNLCVACEYSGRSQDAIKFCQKALQINPKLTKAYYNLAIIYYKQEDYDLAIKYVDRAVELGYKVDPNLLEALKSYRK